MRPNKPGRLEYKFVTTAAAAILLADVIFLSILSGNTGIVCILAAVFLLVGFLSFTGVGVVAGALIGKLGVGIIAGLVVAKTSGVVVALGVNTSAVVEVEAPSTAAVLPLVKAAGF